MERKNVVLSDGDMARQREFTEKIKDLHIQRGKAVHALVDTFGCQQNVADSQHIMGMLEAMGCDFVTEPAEADIIVLNTCAIRDHAEKRVYGNLGALTHTKKANPEQIICLCGCMAQRTGAPVLSPCGSGIRAAGTVEVPGAFVSGVYPSGPGVLGGE